MVECLLCKRKFETVQLTLCNEVSNDQEMICYSCRTTEIRDHVIVYDEETGWVAKVEEEDFTKWVNPAIPNNRLYALPKEDAEKVAK